jgi:hypothetical protein
VSTKEAVRLDSERLLICSKFLLIFAHGGLSVAQSQHGFLNLLELLFQGHGDVGHGGRDGSESDTKLSRSGIYTEPMDLSSATPFVEGLSHNRGRGRSNVGGDILDLILS